MNFLFFLIIVFIFHQMVIWSKFFAMALKVDMVEKKESFPKISVSKKPLLSVQTTFNVQALMTATPGTGTESLTTTMADRMVVLGDWG